MIPTKSNSCDLQSTGTPISSNTVIWQGPNISCLNLCSGDTVSDVVYKLALEVCQLQTDLGISDVDFKCLVDGTTANPTLLSAALQLIIDKVCSLEQLIGTPGSPAVTEAILNVASCFRTTDSSGNEVTQLPHSEYTLQMGIKICSLVTTLNQHSTTLASYGVRITNLENQPDTTYTPPQVTPNCVLPAVPAEMNTVLDALEQQFCELRTATGTPTQLAQSFAKQCVGLGQEPLLNGGGTLSSMNGWVSNPITAAHTLTNLWLTICDLRAAVKNMLNTCCSVSCADFVLDFTGNMNGDKTGIVLFFNTGTVIPAGFTDCTTQGAKVTIKDSAGSIYTTYLNLTAAATDVDGVAISLVGKPVNLNLDYQVTVEGCVTDGHTQCSKTVTRSIVNVCMVPTSVNASLS